MGFPSRFGVMQTRNGDSPAGLSSNSELTMANRAEWMIYGANGYMAISWPRAAAVRTLCSPAAAPVQSRNWPSNSARRVLTLMIRRYSSARGYGGRGELCRPVRGHQCADD
jgi:hypothetical protein